MTILSGKFTARDSFLTAATILNLSSGSSSSQLLRPNTVLLSGLLFQHHLLLACIKDDTIPNLLLSTQLSMGQCCSTCDSLTAEYIKITLGSLFKNEDSWVILVFTNPNICGQSKTYVFPKYILQSFIYYSLKSTAWAISEICNFNPSLSIQKKVVRFNSAVPKGPYLGQRPGQNPGSAIQQVYNGLW